MQIAEEITITHTTNYQNDSLADEYDDEEENENEEKEENENEENEGEEEEDNEEDNKEGEKLETIDLDPIKNPNTKKEEKNIPENTNNNKLNEINTNNEKDNPINNNNIINDIKNENEENKNIENKEKKENEEGEENKEENKEDNNEDNNEENDDKVKIDLNNDNSQNDKISFCHFIIHKGTDLDISNKKIYLCNERIKSGSFFTSKKYNNIQTILLIDEHYLYLLKNKTIAHNNPNLRRINEICDLNKLFDYTINKVDDYYEFSLDFLLEDNFLDRKKKNLLFEEKEADLFENGLIDTLEKIDTVYIDQNNEQEQEEEEDENEDKNEDKKDDEKDKEDKIIKENKMQIDKEKNSKRIFLRNAYGIGERKESLDAKSSSRFIYKNMYV